MVISNKPIRVDYSALSEELDSNHKARKFSVGDRVRVTKFFHQIFIKRRFCTISWTYRIKVSSGWKILSSFYEK